MLIHTFKYKSTSSRKPSQHLTQRLTQRPAQQPTHQCAHQPAQQFTQILTISEADTYQPAGNPANFHMLDLIQLGNLKRHKEYEINS